MTDKTTKGSRQPSLPPLLAMTLLATFACSRFEARRDLKAGNSAYTEGKYPQAIEHYDKVSADYPDGARAALNTGYAHWKQYRFGSSHPIDREHAQKAVAAFDRYIESLQVIYDALPKDWLVFLEHKLYEPAFYATVIADWGSSLMAAQELGPKAKCLVDLGHHPPNTNIEQIVARLVRAKKLAGFHFNDSKYGDDDLDSGSVDPFRLFLVFNELVDAELRRAEGFQPAYMIDQSHNVTDPIESLMASAIEIQRAFIQASLIDRAALAAAQEASDVMLGHRAVKQAFITDVSPILAEARRRKGGALDPVSLYRGSGYRARKASERQPVEATSAGIV